MSDEIDLELELALAEAEAVEKEQAAPQPPAERSPLPPSTPLETAGTGWMGALKGATANLPDEITGGLRAAYGAAGRLGLDLANTSIGRRMLRTAAGVPDTIPDAALDLALPELARRQGIAPRDTVAETMAATYRRGRDDYRDVERLAFQRNPKAALTGELVGALAMPVPAGKAQVGTAVLNRMGQRALQGAAQGGVMGFGGSEGDLTQGEVGKVLADTAMGAGAGAGLQVGLGAVADKAGGALRRWSEDNALRAMGLRAGITDRLRKLGIKTGEDAQRELGKRALDEGLVGLGSTPTSILRDVQQTLPFVGEAKGQIIADAQAAASAAGRRADFEAAADAARRAAFEGADEIALAKGGAARRLVDLIRQQGETATDANSLVMLDRLKQSAQDSLRPLTPHLAQQQVNAVAGSLRSEVERQVGDIAGEEFASALRGVNARYGFLKKVEDITSRASTQDIGNKGALGMVVGAAAGGSGGPLGGLGGAAAGQFFQRHIAPGLPATKAVLERGLSRMSPGGARATATLGTEAATSDGGPSDVDPVTAALRWMTERHGEQPQSMSELAGSAFLRGQRGQ